MPRWSVERLVLLEDGGEQWLPVLRTSDERAARKTLAALRKAGDESRLLVQLLAAVSPWRQVA